MLARREGVSRSNAKLTDGKLRAAARERKRFSRSNAKLACGKLRAAARKRDRPSSSTRKFGTEAVEIVVQRLTPTVGSGW